MNSADERVVAIRADKLVGRGSCSMIDECISDVDLITDMNRAGIRAPKSAAKWARKLQLQWLEQGLNQREGNDDDVQLLDYNDFNEAMKHD